MKTLRKYLFFFFLFVFPLFSFAGQSKIDSLRTFLKTDREDTGKVLHLNALGWELKYINTDSSIVLSKQALALIQDLLVKVKSTPVEYLADTYGNLGVFEYYKGNYSDALHYYFRALAIDEKLLKEAQQNDDLAGIGRYSSNRARRFNNIGNIYLEEADYAKALELFLKSLKVFEDLKDDNRIGIALGNIARVYFNQKDYSRGLEYSLKALSLAEHANNTNEIAIQLTNIASDYKEMRSYSQLLVYSLRALKMAEQSGNKYLMGVNLALIGTYYSDKGDYDQALNYYFKALKINKEVGNANSVALNLSNIGANYTFQKKYNEAFNFLYRSLGIADSLHVLNTVKLDYELLSDLYEGSSVTLLDTIGGSMLRREQMPERALYYYKRFIALRDSIFSKEKTEELVRKDLNYQFEKKEAMAKAEQEKRSVLAETEKKKRQFILYSVISGLGIVLLFAALIFQSLRTTKKQKYLIEQQKHLVEEKQKEVLDSIRYARRIQTALLPTERYIGKTLDRLTKNN